VSQPLRTALRDIAEGNCPGSLIDATASAPTQAEAQRQFHMALTSWMQRVARAALATPDEAPAQWRCNICGGLVDLTNAEKPTAFVGPGNRGEK
jgi:hypothetical protein